MAKRIKPKNLLDDTEQYVISNDISNDVEKTSDNEIDSINNNTNEEIDVKSLQDTIVELTNKNSDLEVKLAETIEKLNATKNDLSKVEELSKTVSRLEKENKALRDENDSYLVKISELTFENATKTCQLQELQKLRTSVKTNSANAGIPQPISKRPLNSDFNNGYSSWN